MTPAIQYSIQLHIEAGLDPTLYHWFDISNAALDKLSFDWDIFCTFKPPFKRCMVVWELQDDIFEMYVEGDDLEKGVNLTVFNCKTAEILKSLQYVLVGEKCVVRALHDTTLTEQDAKRIMGIAFGWYQILAQQSIPVYQPYVRPTILNQRKIAKGKPPKYEWKTVYLEPIKPRSEPKGGTHASPRLHDRRGHLRRLRNGRSVWVRPCKVGDASKGAVWHDYAIRSAS